MTPELALLILLDQGRTLRVEPQEIVRILEELEDPDIGQFTPANEGLGHTTDGKTDPEESAARCS